MKDLSRKRIKHILVMNSIDNDHPLREEIEAMGFLFDGIWIVNPFWSVCGRFEVDPIEEYGDDFLESPIASFLGYRPMVVTPTELMSFSKRAKHENDLMKKIRAQDLR